MKEPFEDFLIKIGHLSNGNYAVNQNGSDCKITNVATKIVRCFTLRNDLLHGLKEANPHQSIVFAYTIEDFLDTGKLKNKWYCSLIQKETKCYKFSVRTNREGIYKVNLSCEMDFYKNGLTYERYLLPVPNKLLSFEASFLDLVANSPENRLRHLMGDIRKTL